MHHMQKETRQKHSVSAGFVAGAEGLEPSARGFGVDVETAHRERGRDKVAPFYQPSHKTGGAGLVLRGKTQLPRALRGLEKALCISFLTKS